MAFCYLGDARFNMANSYLVVGRQARHGRADRRAASRCGRRRSWSTRRAGFAAASGGRVTITEDVEEAVRGCDFLLTDVWVSMGESDDVWAERIELLMPYQINAQTMAADRQPGRQVHALPAGVPQHRHARSARRSRRSSACTALEVTEEVFESPASIVFDEAENRMHTIKAVMVATLGS